jgi:hypothetical protein
MGVGLRTLAWNEDTINEYRISLYYDQTFSYGVRDSKKRVTQYYGLYTISPDTIFLSFKAKEPPMCPYLVKELSGTYLIQYFLDGRKRMFLRKEIPPLQRR